MKNFTLLLVMILFSPVLNAENGSELQKKIQQKQESFARINQMSAKIKSLAKLNGFGVHLKSAEATQKLDSTLNRVLNQETQLWQNDYKDEYLYDAEMKNTAWVEKEWNLTANSWDIISKTELGFDNSDRINSMIMYERDELTQVIKKVSKFLVVYNSEGMQETMSMSSSEDDGVTWILEMKQINHYNEAKQLTKTDIWGLDEDLGELILNMNLVNTYTGSGKINTASMTVLDEGDEIPWSITEYKYDSSEKLTAIEHSMISFLTFTMEKSSRILYQYNASGNRTAEINSKWNGTTWVDEDKTEYGYNSAGDVSTEIYSTWNGTSWIEESKDEYTFGTTNFSEVAFPQIDFMMDIFSSFLNFFGINESIDFSYVKAPAGANSFEMINGNWVNTEKTTFHYSGGTSTNINEFENSMVSVYPNPASEQVNFNWKGNFDNLSLEMYQNTGAKVMEQITYSGKPVSISKLENGVYFFRLLNGDDIIFKGKLIKK
jgi:hypothetical protein